MKTKLAAVTLALFTAAAQAQAQTKDGAWFAQFSSLTQLAFVAGFIEGAHTGGTAAVLYACPQEGKAFLACVESGSGVLHDKYSKYLSGVPADQIHKGVLAFYADYRNQKLQVAYAIIHSGKAIAGVPAADLEKSLEFARQAASR